MRFTPGSGWSTTGSMPTPLFDHRAIRMVFSGEVLVVGDSPAAQLYSPTSGTWRATGGLAVPRSAGTLSLLNDGRIVYAGGALPGNVYSGVVEVYNYVLGTWERTGSLWYPHAFHTAAVTGDGRLFVIGGHFGDVAANSAVEVFNPVWGS